jgi:hypothetical protein
MRTAQTLDQLRPLNDAIDQDLGDLLVEVLPTIEAKLPKQTAREWQQWREEARKE